MSTKRVETSFIKHIGKILWQNIRDWGMYIVLLIIMAIFTITTKGVFISSRNIGNLIDQTGYLAVLAVGMTLVIIIRDMDLSVGFLAGFLGAVAAISMVSWHLPVYACILLVLGLGVLAGLLTGFLVAQMKIPAFVATLAGWLGYRGALLLATMSRGTIVIPSDTFNAIGNGYIPDILGLGILPGVHKLTLILGVLAILLFIVSAINNRRRMRAYDSKVLAMPLFIIELVFVSALVGAITWVLAGYKGLSWTGVVLLIVVIFYNFVMSRTVLGRHIYAVGGNPEAAELSGISFKKITYVVFASMGLLAAVSGILFASRFKSATTTAGTLFEFDAITAAFIGGASPGGGVGKVTGSIVGAFAMMSLTSGMNLMGIDISYQYIVKGLVLAGAVIFDIAARNRAKE
jgi:putative multiple sugar transport system permease protein